MKTVKETQQKAVSAIVKGIQDTPLTAMQCSEIFRALMEKANVIGGKIFTTEDLAAKLEEAGFKRSNNNVYEVQSVIDNSILNDCQDDEWIAIQNAIASVSYRLEKEAN